MENHEQRIKFPSRYQPLINFLQGVALTLFTLAIIVTIYLTVIYHARVAPFINYAIVFDAGSSHTEMFVYHWPADKSDGVGTTSTVNEYFVCPLVAVQSEDGIKFKAISDFDQRLDLLEGYFRPCLKQALEKIPSTRYKYSPIFLGATAGMRLTRLQNFTRSNQVLEKIREIFSNYPFQFVTARQVRILTGMEEAVDGWITTNILLEKFKLRHAKRGKLPESVQLDPDMVGVLDLGGASTQVTFTYTHQVGDEPIPSEFTTNISLFDDVYQPYAHSYLCWGKNEALRRYRARLINAAINSNRSNSPISSRIPIHDPCLPRGANESISLTKIFGSPCTANEKQKFAYKLNVSSLNFIGSGNAQKCQTRLKQLFDAKRNDLTVNCSYKQEYCTFDQAFQPKLPSKINFIGLSGYYYVFDNLAYGMRRTAGTSTERYKLKDFSKDEISRRLINVCETSYSILYHQEKMTASNEQHKRGLCFDAWYMWLLLTYGIGFTQNDLKRLSFANTFPTGKVGWTLGYMINQTNYIPAEFREKTIGKNRFYQLALASIFIAIVTLIFLLFTCLKYIRIRYSKRTDQFNTTNKDGYSQPHEQSTV